MSSPRSARRLRSLARSLAAAAALALLASGAPARAADHKSAPPAKPAIEYPAYDTHPAEHVTIAAEPCDDPKACSFFRLEYVQHGVLPIRVIITNDSDTALSLDDARIHLLPETGARVQAATEDDLNRRLFNTRSAKGTKIPIIPITIHHAPIDKKITEDTTDFGFQGTVVNAHTTLAGFVFYDISELDDPALRHAELLVKMVHTLDARHELFPFNVPLDKWLAANPAAPSNRPRR
ncbi:MAG: hypothetical protein M3O02_07115 [Acidobacteriota bacterium]|nr:hypothetical protein [Acidobacteriota bacterium]